MSRPPALSELEEVSLKFVEAVSRAVLDPLVRRMHAPHVAQVLESLGTAENVSPFTVHVLLSTQAAAAALGNARVAFVGPGRREVVPMDLMSVNEVFAAPRVSIVGGNSRRERVLTPPPHPPP
jgi:hypothetical protein